MQYVVRGHNNVQRAPLSNCQREPAHVAETMKFMASLKASGSDFYVTIIHQMSPRS